MVCTAKLRAYSNRLPIPHDRARAYVYVFSRYGKTANAAYKGSGPCPYGEYFHKIFQE